MLKKLIEQAKTPKKPLSTEHLLKLLLLQSFFLLVVLLVVVFWPERAPATSTFLIMALGIAMGLWLDIQETSRSEPCTQLHHNPNASEN